MTDTSRQLRLASYLLANPDPIPPVYQGGHLTHFTRLYFSYLSQGGAPVDPQDLDSIDLTLRQWEKTP